MGGARDYCFCAVFGRLEGWVGKDACGTAAQGFFPLVSSPRWRGKRDETSCLTMEISTGSRIVRDVFLELSWMGRF